MFDHGSNFHRPFAQVPGLVTPEVRAAPLLQAPRSVFDASFVQRYGVTDVKVTLAGSPSSPSSPSAQAAQAKSSGVPMIIVVAVGSACGAVLLMVLLGVIVFVVRQRRRQRINPGTQSAADQEARAAGAGQNAGPDQLEQPRKVSRSTPSQDLDEKGPDAPPAVISINAHAGPFAASPDVPDEGNPKPSRSSLPPINGARR